MELTLVTLATFALVTSLVVSAYYALTAETPVAERLRRLVGEAPAPQPTERRSRVRDSLVQQFLLLISEFGFGGTDSVAHTMSVAGFRGPNATKVFLGTRTLVSIGPALTILVLSVSVGRPVGRALTSALLMWAVGHAATVLWLKRRARHRVEALGRALPDALDLMVVCLEAGLGLNQTIARVGQERATMDDPLGLEFAQVSLELRSGRSREEALRALGERNGVDDLKALAALIIQSDRLGASMARTLRVHSDLLRTKRRQRAEEAARKLPIKLLFPLAAFILPPLFVVAAGPALINLREFMKVMAHH
jgi:tight adherence protein C